MEVALASVHAMLAGMGRSAAASTSVTLSHAERTVDATAMKLRPEAPQQPPACVK
jgi:hypothetical protein